MSNNAIVTLSDPRSTAAEAYRTLRTNIEFSGVDQKLHTLLVTSSAPTDEKSATVANLAVAMADGDRPVILVDADLRRPSQHTLFDLSNDKGFTNLFKDEEAFKVVNKYGGEAIVVTTEQRNTAAKWRLSSPSEVRQWLRELIVIVNF